MPLRVAADRVSGVIDMQVRAERGAIVAHGRRGIQWSQELADLDQSAYPMLYGLCAYLDTIFNQRQIPLLLGELDRLPDGAVLDNECRAEIRRLAGIVLGEPHRYLWFAGD
jgi:hypothetical protein